MPQGAFPNIPHEEILRYEEIVRIASIAVGAGVRKFRLTGGEPLVRKGLPTLVGQLSTLSPPPEICLTTNGALLRDVAQTLKKAGLARITISLDSLKTDRFHEITGGGQLEDVLAGIEAALQAGLSPVKVNAVILKGLNDDEIPDFASLAERLKIEVRFIEYMPLGRESWPDRFLSAQEMEKRLVDHYGESLPPLTENEGPATRQLRLPGGGVIGFITPISAPFCGLCDRLRLTSAGIVRACLIRGGEVDIKKRLREGATDEEILSLLHKAWTLKPTEHGLLEGQEKLPLSECHGMRSIGG
jgi:cyclic pyranopterin phosphate synthase